MHKAIYTYRWFVAKQPQTAWFSIYKTKHPVDLCVRLCAWCVILFCGLNLTIALNKNNLVFMFL
jgi:hypothetical protein